VDVLNSVQPGQWIELARVLGFVLFVVVVVKVRPWRWWSAFLRGRRG